ncbi:hypothetical protein N7528_007540 [Penicillium herquei]|nr:hypothetical protein N7528_007540 [Penicillium herquei]
MTTLKEGRGVGEKIKDKNYSRIINEVVGAAWLVLLIGSGEDHRCKLKITSIAKQTTAENAV